MPRTHEPTICSDGSKVDCECDECYGNDLKDKFPGILHDFSAKEVTEVWSHFSEQSCATWLNDDHRETVFQVFCQAPKWIELGKPEDFWFRSGTEFDIRKVQLK